MRCKGSNYFRFCNPKPLFFTTYRKKNILRIKADYLITYAY